eukprot:TRINITY_DN11060_c0_g5_i1.p1 TRINITY_DN11060_c0_g5~~TRINITY_DN11060_c0_g5_i1.p1  ORF type:complete len:486 (+),score=82.10 TRINITY_DN11060_c0_g5_i1:304-1761(+)
MSCTIKSQQLVVVLLTISIVAVLGRNKLSGSNPIMFGDFEISNGNNNKTVTKAPTPPKTKPVSQKGGKPAPTPSQTSITRTPSPTPAPTPSPTPSPTPAPTPSPTPSPTPAPTPSPTPSPTPAPTPSPTLSEEARAAEYHRCVTAVMTKGNVTGCPRNPVKNKRLLVLVGDSTARQLALTVEKGFRTLSFTMGKRVTKLMTHQPPTVTFENGVKVETTIVLIGLCRIYDIREQLITSTEWLLRDFGEPDVVFFTTGGLHECKVPLRNFDTMYAEVMKKKVPATYQTDWVRNIRKNVNPPILSVGVQEYVNMQSPCFMETIRKMRIMLPKAVMVWRPFLNADHLRTGGLVPAQKYSYNYCRRNKDWSKFRLGVCGFVHQKHKEYSKTIRAMGIAVIDNELFYPNHCTTGDSLHLSASCQRIIYRFIRDIQRLGPQVVPSGMSVSEEVCADGYFKKKLNEVKPLLQKNRPLPEEDGSIKQCLKKKAQ